MKTIKLYREDNGQYSTSEAKQDDVSGVYVQKSDYDELKRENEGLRASNNELRTSFKDALWFLGCNMDVSKYNAVLEETPEQSLADIKADAVEEVAELHKRQMQYAHGHFEDTVIFECDLLEHAEKLRGEQ
jgi:hypothetical protein